MYAATQGMMACNNSDMHKPSLHLFYYGVTHFIIVAGPHTLYCCIYTTIIPCLAANILHLFLFNGSVLLPLYL